jgi:hypothetical protein
MVLYDDKINKTNIFVVLNSTIMTEYSTIKVRPETKKVTTRLAEKHEMNMLDFMHAMANYFDKTGVNPRDMQILSPAEELKKFRDTIIAFLRKQEKDFILPVFSRVDTLAARFIQYIETEAPKRENDDKKGIASLAQNDLSSIIPSINKDKEKEITSINIKDNPEYKRLIVERDQLNVKYETLKGYFEKIINNTSVKSTGFNKLPVIDNFTQADLNDYKQYLNRL